MKNQKLGPPLASGDVTQPARHWQQLIRGNFRRNDLDRSLAFESQQKKPRKKISRLLKQICWL
jgi:hypothetical protein